MLRILRRSTSKQCKALIEHDGETYIRASAYAEALTFPLVKLPFRKGEIIVKVQELSHAQIKRCGDFSLINLGQKQKQTVKSLMEATRLQHAIAKECLVSPTFEQLVKACQVEEVVKRHKKVIEGLRKRVNSMKPGPAQELLLEEIDVEEMWTEFPLPNNFTAALIEYATGSYRTDIDKVDSRDMLKRAAVLASNGHDNPHDHIGGVFNDFNREDIDNRAWIILQEDKEE